jgi:hypothetical protein
MHVPDVSRDTLYRPRSAALRQTTTTTDCHGDPDLVAPYDVENPGRVDHDYDRALAESLDAGGAGRSPMMVDQGLPGESEVVAPC